MSIVKAGAMSLTNRNRRSLEHPAHNVIGYPNLLYNAPIACGHLMVSRLTRMSKCAWAFPKTAPAEFRSVVCSRLLGPDEPL